MVESDGGSDAVTMVPSVAIGEFGRYDFLAVYDGYGGARVANACSDRIHQLVAKEVAKGERIGWGKGLEYWKKLMGACFEKIDEELMLDNESGGGDVETGKGVLSVKNMGSTAVVVMVGKEEMVAGRVVGDSRAVMCRSGVAVPSAHDHKPDRPDERERVEAEGGRVMNWNGSRVVGVLATSRSIGDQYLKPFVISEPEVTASERTDSDEFIVMATDGLWHAFTNEVACEVVRKLFDGQIKRRIPEEYNV
ncbi:PREDICTED: probable protein phosphatase 2C 8 [Populus euphratica]|uniref:Probable protein phosphatase 2C 8 n=1 Tax=Populus euphratica TaxID=75702 RepID=A0AAJ6U384_POPEU|nr:PREDICTED: probable protein phosphatase 2C 8 [Populus euphratica]